MCGIIGYIGKKNATPILINGLKRLEYRGYDSAGIALDSNQKSNQLTIIKATGKIADLEKQLVLQEEHATCGIGHTRWATHGEPTKENAHPHTNTSKTFALVHNGIIENAQHIRASLEKEGYTFTSQTDTESLVHLIDFFFKKSQDLEQSLRNALTQVQGTYGIALIQKNNEKIYVARKGSPLLIGIGEQEMFLASDAAALIEHTKKVQYLQDGDFAIIESHGYALSRIDGTKQEKSISHIKWSLEEAEKNGHDFFMHKEIHEQPKVLENTIRGRIRNNQVKLSITLPAQLKKIHIVACGTSYNAGLLAKQYIEKYARIPVDVCIASEFRYNNPILDQQDLVIGISQSGETADTLAAIVEAKRRNITTLGIINTVGSTIAREVTSGIYIHAGIEIGVASTKAFTCQATALLLLSYYIARHLGYTITNEQEEALMQLSPTIENILATEEELKSVADMFRDATTALYIARGICVPVCLEGALKCKEISYVHAEGFAAGELKHGSIALVDENVPVVCLLQKDHTYEKMLSNIQEIKTRKGKVIAITEYVDDELKNIADKIITVPKIHEDITPLLMNIPLQLIAYHVALARNLDVDKPRNLAKSVTVE